MSDHKNIPVDPETHETIDRLKQETGSESFDAVVRDMAEENLDADWEDLTVEQREQRLEQTQTTIVAIIEAVDEYDLTEDVLDILKSLSQQDMLAKNQEIVGHLMRKAEAGQEPNEMDRLLARIVIQTEQERDIEQSPAGEIAQGLFSGSDTTTATRTETTATRQSVEEDTDSVEVGDDLDASFEIGRTEVGETSETADKDS